MKSQLVGWPMVAGLLILGISATAGGENRSDQRAGGKAAQSQSAEIPNSQIPNSQIDPQAFLTAAKEATELRARRRLTEDEFIRLSREQGVIVLDARSKDRYDQIHIKGAMSLPFTDFTFDSLRERLPHKSVKILIYCNNNFRGNVPEFLSKSPGAALNLSTFSSLYEYGYRNVYELGPELDLDKTKLELVGANVFKYVKR